MRNDAPQDSPDLRRRGTRSKRAAQLGRPKLPSHLVKGIAVPGGIVVTTKLKDEHEEHHPAMEGSANLRARALQGRRSSVADPPRAGNGRHRHLSRDVHRALWRTE